MSDVEDNTSNKSASPKAEGSKKRKHGSPDGSSPTATSSRKFFENEAEESSGDESNHSDRVVEDEGVDSYQKDGFVVSDSDLDSDEDLFDKTQLKKKKKRELKRIVKKKQTRLDEEDYELIKDNTYGFGSSPKQAKRAKLDEDAPEDDQDDVDEPEPEDQGSNMPRSLKPPAPDDDYDSDLSDFIEDEFANEEMEDDGTGVPRPRPQKAVRRARVRVGPTIDQLKDAADIFGDGFDDFDDEKDELLEEELEDEDLTEEERLKKTKDKMRLKYDRAVLIENFCTEQDDIIRQTDRPERMQFTERIFPSDKELEDEAQWMGPKLHEWMTLIGDVNADVSTAEKPCTPEALSLACQFVLKFYHIDQLEIPFIVTYRRDYLHDSLAAKHLWKMLEYDLQWQRLNTVRDRLRRILTAVEDAAKSSKDSQADWEQQSRTMLSQIAEAKLSIRRMKAEVEAAEEDHEAAMNVVDQRDDEATVEERAFVEKTAIQVQKLQAKLENENQNLQEQIERFEQERNRQIMSVRYQPEAAAEVHRLFPNIRYEVMIKTARDETDLRDISDFLALLLKGSEAKKAEKANKDVRAEGAKAAEQEQKRAQNAVSESLFGADNDDEDDAAESGWNEDSQGDDSPKKKLMDTSGLYPTESAGELPQEEQMEIQELMAAQVHSSAASRHKINLGKDDYLKFKQIPTLRELVERIAVPASDFGDSLKLGFKCEPPVTPSARPEELAAQYVDGRRLTTPSVVLHGVSQIIAAELSFEPCVRRFTRNQYRNRASISTRPTALGATAINPFSELFGLHYLDEKPVGEFFKGSRAERCSFLRLLEAEKAGLITVTVNPPLKSSDTEAGVRVLDISPFLDLYHLSIPSRPVADEADPAGREMWDRFRQQIIQRALDKHILPTLQQELRRDLLKAAKEAVLEQCREKFALQLSQGPYIPLRLLDDKKEFTKRALRSCPGRPYNFSVAAIFQENSSQTSVSMAFVDQEGILRQHTVLPAKAGAEKLKEKLRVFLFDNRPDIIVLNASGGRATRNTKYTLEKTVIPQVVRMFAEARNDISSRYYDDDDDDEASSYNPNVTILPDELARLFKNSSRSKKMLPDLEPSTAAAVSLARFSQEPLAEYAGLWTSFDAVNGFGYEALFLDLHPLKHLVRGSKSQLLSLMESCLVDAVCAVGVDINKAVSHDHYAPMLAFVGGLGLRKADALRREIRRSIKFVDSRDVLLSKKVLGALVYTNAAGFLRIATDNADLNINRLDNTRVHPECYITHKFTYKLFASSQDIDFQNLSDKRYVELVEAQFQDSRHALERRMKENDDWLAAWNDLKPPAHFSKSVVVKFRDGTSQTQVKSTVHELNDKLSSMSIEQYAQLLMKDFGRRQLQLESIKHEVRYPWLDTRKPMRSLEDHDLFTIITGETDCSLYVGLKVGCTVQEISDVVDSNTDRRRQRAFVTTDSGLRGHISAFDVLDGRIDPQNFDIDRYLRTGQHLVAVVVGVNKRNYSVDLSIKPSLLAVGEDWWLEQRYKEPQAERWYQSIGRDRSKLFDRCFLEAEALRTYSNAEGRASEHMDTSSNTSNRAESSSRTSSITAANTQANAMPLTRSVTHPFFRNCDYREAEEILLREFSVGDMIVRPSSKGANKLAITWAFQPELFKHIDVEERGQRRGGANSGLGNELVILEPDMEQQIFTDLDHIHQAYITPMNDFVESMVRHRSFRPGGVEAVQEYLREQLIENPRQIPYCVRLEPTKPGCFTLTWMSLNKDSAQPFKKELVYVRPNGYKLKNELFARPSDLIAWFKKAAIAALRAPPAGGAAAASSHHGGHHHGGAMAASAGAGVSAGAGAGASQRRSNLFNRAAPVATAEGGYYNKQW